MFKIEIMNTENLKALFGAMNENGYGSSAKAITSNILDTKNKRRDAPYDFGDFQRCYWIVENTPYLKANLDKMKSVSKAWQLVVENWEEYGYHIKEGNRQELNDSFRLLHQIARAHDSY